MDMESFEVNLVKDHQGLGIIVAGYVCVKEKIFSNSSVIDNYYSLNTINTEEIKAKWEKVLGPRSEIIVRLMEKQLRNTKYSEILTIFKSLPSNIVLVCGRSHHWTSNLSLIPWSERLIKAKSDSYLATRKCVTSGYHNMNRRSLEILSSLATWSSEPHFIDLVKGEEGLGFSIVEYKVILCINLNEYEMFAVL
ncbi:multiple PDZ domain protein [Caerostris extrusa]|uniref:Multiple PDZ domain protein n=1 Tax=Caerostris extrusa TaxID=172846 RepID=A0AAV4RM40_CAEEX|nr:multiple PDZ domain protein [Caerostris extrusa]